MKTRIRKLDDGLAVVIPSTVAALTEWICGTSAVVPE